VQGLVMQYVKNARLQQQQQRQQQQQQQQQLAC
jgi:hypothetical protein